MTFERPAETKIPIAGSVQARDAISLITGSEQIGHQDSRSRRTASMASLRRSSSGTPWLGATDSGPRHRWSLALTQPAPYKIKSPGRRLGEPNLIGMNRSGARECGYVLRASNTRRSLMAGSEYTLPAPATLAMGSSPACRAPSTPPTPPTRSSVT